MFNPLIRTIGILSLSVTISGCQGNKTTGTIKIASDGRVSSAGLVAKVSNGQCVQLPLLIESLKTSESQTARVYVDSLDLFVLIALMLFAASPLGYLCMVQP